MNQRNARLERKQVQLGQWSRDAGLTWPGHCRPASLTSLDFDAVRTVPGRTQTDIAGHVCHLRWESWTSAKCLRIITGKSRMCMVQGSCSRRVPLDSGDKCWLPPRPARDHVLYSCYIYLSPY